MPMAAKRVIVTAEEIVDTEILRRNPDRRFCPGFIVDAVVEVPYGAHPTSFFPNYTYDSSFHREWAAVSRDRETASLSSIATSEPHRPSRSTWKQWAT